MMLERLASCFGFSRRKAEEERKRAEKERIEQSIREAVAWTVSSHGGNINLQQGRFIT